MAEKTEFLQAIDDAILDADSLERFINGSDSDTVLTRLSAQYPTLQRAIKQMFENGGLPATPFATKASMEASALVDGDYAMVTDGGADNGLYLKTAGAWVRSAYDLEKIIRAKVQNTFGTYAQMVSSNLSDGAYALVADDTDDKNGTYIKDGGEWVKSKYDPIGKFSDTVKVVNTNSSDIYSVFDSNGQSVVKTTADGKHYFAGLANDLETELNAKAYIEPTSNYIFEVRDVNGKTTLKQDTDGHVHLPHIGRLTDFYNSVKDQVNFDWTKAIYKAGKFADNALIKEGQLFRSNKNVLTPSLIDPYFSYKINVLRVPSMIPIAKNKFLVPFEAREDWGDVGKNSCASCILTIDSETKEPTVSDIVVVHEAEVLEDTRVKRFMNPAAVQLDDGKTIIMTYLTSIEKDWHDLLMVKSTDNGKTWGQPVSIGSQVMQDNWVLPVTSSGGFVKQHAPHKGRIIMPFFIHVDEWVGINARIGFIYSDNNGQTWSTGKLASYTSATENQVIEDYNGDLLMSIRVEEKNTPRRFARYSWDLQDYIDIPVQDNINNEPSQAGFCQGENKWSNTNGKILFSTSKWGWKHTTPETAALRRSGLLVCVSYDACESWTVYNYPEIDRRRMGYSNICPLDDNHVVVTYESEGSNIACAIVSLKTIREEGV